MKILNYYFNQNAILEILKIAEAAVQKNNVKYAKII